MVIMKKDIKKILGSTVITGGILIYSFSGGFASGSVPEVKVNGISVYSPLSYSLKNKTMLDVDAFFTVLKADYSYNKEKSTISYKEKTITVKKKNTGLVADIKELAELIDAANVKVEKDGNIYILVLPENTVKLTVSPETAAENRAHPSEDVLLYETADNSFKGEEKSIPAYKTIYGIYEGELIFLEQMIAQTYMEGNQAKSWTNLPGMEGLPSPAVFQTDVEFHPSGHAHYEVPHYDFHHYFISDEEQQAIKGTRSN